MAMRGKRWDSFACFAFRGIMGTYCGDRLRNRLTEPCKLNSDAVVEHLSSLSLSLLFLLSFLFSSASFDATIRRANRNSALHSKASIFKERFNVDRPVKYLFNGKGHREARLALLIHGHVICSDS